MKKLLFYVQFMALLLLSAACSRYQTVAGDPLDAQIYTLSNGLQVYMTVNKETPRIQTYIAVKVGSKNDPSETTGLAHYFEHLMFKGTQQFGTSDYDAEKPMLDEIEALFETYRQTADEAERAAIYHRIDSVSYEASRLAIPNEYDKLMALIGAEGTNAWTSSDETVYVEDIPSNQIDNWARIQADRFRHNVIRGFHTELETIYEEKNMSLTQDNRKVWAAIDEALFPNHPYGKQTTLGSQEHLKNPSITNVKKYHDTYYVPNNIRICVSGDFKPAEMVAAIEKYFGDWEANPSIPVLEFEKEKPIVDPVVKNVYGLEAENLAIAWRLPGASDAKTMTVAGIASMILSNGQAGVFDLDILQQQKALRAAAFANPQPDYSSFLLVGAPQAGQSLEQLRDLLLEEAGKLASGDFDESLIPASVSNVKLQVQQMLESNQSRARMFVESFINGISWEENVKRLSIYDSITKDDVMSFAKEYLAPSAYAVVYKRQGEDPTVQKISAPKITPIVTNRDQQSAFLKEIKASTVKPIEPVYVDFGKDMSRAELADGVDLLYKKNEKNGIFELDFVFNTGTENDPAIGTAFRYLPYLGTKDMSAEDFARKMYALACDFRMGAGATQSTLSIGGLAENMAQALGLVNSLVEGAVADDAILANLKADMLKSRSDGKKQQRSCFSALQRYMFYGPEFIAKNTLSNEALMALTSEDLLSKVREVMAKGCEVMYYGPASIAEVKSAVGITEAREALPEVNTCQLPTPAPAVYLAQYDANQLYYAQYSNRGETFDASAAPSLALYNEYFGGGMNSIVFQEMREARGLAYSAGGRLYAPRFVDDAYYFVAFIATQNDKMRQAVEAFDEIINDMPDSEAAFQVAKESLIGSLRTKRIIGSDVLWTYRNCRRLGIDEPLDRAIFEKVQDMTLEDVKTFQQKMVKGRVYNYAILGNIKDLDTKYLETLGPVRTVSLEEIFGY